MAKIIEFKRVPLSTRIELEDGVIFIYFLVREDCEMEGLWVSPCYPFKDDTTRFIPSENIVHYEVLTDVNE